MKMKDDFTALGAFVIWLYVNDLSFYKEFESRFKKFIDEVSKPAKESKKNG